MANTDPGLQARLIRDLGVPVPPAPSVLLNWRGPPFTYQTVSFADVFNDMLSRERKRPLDEFAGKIVLIGSTAPSLFDIKPTPMGSLHPGVEILATAIDNMKHDDYLRFPAGRIVYPLLAMLIIWVIAISTYRNPEGSRIDRMVGLFEIVLLSSSYASINLTHTYINLTGPFTAILAYYAVARLYGVATRNVLETNALRDSIAREEALGAVLLLLRLPDSAQQLPGIRMWQMRDSFVKLCKAPCSVDLIEGRQKGIWSLFEHTLAVSWIFAETNTRARSHALADIERITSVINAKADANAAAHLVNWIVHEGRINGGAHARAGWMELFAEAQLQWQDKISREKEQA